MINYINTLREVRRPLTLLTPILLTSMTCCLARAQEAPPDTPAAPAVPAPAPGLTRDQLMGLVESRTSEAGIAAIATRVGVAFQLVQDDMDRLRAAGYSPGLLLTLVKAGRGLTRPTGAPEAGPARVESPVASGPVAVEGEVFVNTSTDWANMGKCFTGPEARLGEGDIDEAFALAARLVPVYDEKAGPLPDQAARLFLRAAAGLLNAGLPATACSVVQPIFGGRPSAETHGCALSFLERLGAEIDCPIVSLSAPLSFDPAALAQNLFDRHCFLVGREILARGGDAVMARKFLRSVREDALDLDRAGLLLALSLANDRRYRSAVQVLLPLARGAGVRTSGVAVPELAHLTLARIAFDNNLFDEALYHYREVPPDSRLWPEATHERTWAALRAGHHAEAVGAALALHSPTVRPRRFHDAWLVVVVALEDHCMLDEAEGLAGREIASLERIRRENRSLLDRFGIDIACSGGRQGGETADPPDRPTCDFSGTDARLLVERFPGLLADPALHAGHDFLLKAGREARVLAGILGRLPGLNATSDLLKAESARRMGEFREASGRAFLAHARAAEDALASFLEARVDIDSARRGLFEQRMHKEVREGHAEVSKSDIIGRIERMARDGRSASDLEVYVVRNARGLVFTEGEFARIRSSGADPEFLDFLDTFFRRRQAREAAVDPTGEDPRLVWEFDGEFWGDEMSGLRVGLTNRCWKRE